MQLRSVLRITAYGMLAHVLLLPVAWVAAAILLNVLIFVLQVDPRATGMELPIVFGLVRFGLFGVVGFKLGTRVDQRKIANAVLAGILLTVGVQILDAAIYHLLPKGQPKPGGLAHRQQIGVAAGWILYLGMIGLQIALAAAGGWLAARRNAGQADEEIGSSPDR